MCPVLDTRPCVPWRFVAAYIYEQHLLGKSTSWKVHVFQMSQHPSSLLSFIALISQHRQLGLPHNCRFGGPEYFNNTPMMMLEGGGWLTFLRPTITACCLCERQKQPQWPMYIYHGSYVRTIGKKTSVTNAVVYRSIFTVKHPPKDMTL